MLAIPAVLPVVAMWRPVIQKDAETHRGCTNLRSRQGSTAEPSGLANSVLDVGVLEQRRNSHGPAGPTPGRQERLCCCKCLYPTSGLAFVDLGFVLLHSSGNAFRALSPSLLFASTPLQGEQQPNSWEPS